MVKQHRNVMTFVDILAHLCILRRRAAGNRPLEIEQFLEDVYMNKRIHSSLNYLTPDEYERKWNEQNGKNDKIQEEFS
jgi:transposase InsO family protein